jgi:hypothetical protein
VVGEDTNHGEKVVGEDTDHGTPTTAHRPRHTDNAIPQGYQ